MMTAAWMAWREMIARKGWTLAGVLAVASAVALCSTLEILSRAREEAVSTRADQMGPPLKVVPAGLNSLDLARFDTKGRYFSKDMTSQIRDALGPRARAVEGRLLVQGVVNGRFVPFVGVEPKTTKSPFTELSALKGRDVALGSVIASTLSAVRGDVLRFRGTGLRIAAVLPSNGGPEDLAVFIPLKRLQEIFDLPGATNVIRVFPRRSDDLGPVSAIVTSHTDGTALIVSGDPEGTRNEIGAVLSGHRWALYAASAVVVALCILIWSYLRALAGRLEIASVAAMGGGAVLLILLLALPATLLGLIGALVGYLAAVVIALAMDFGAAAPVAVSGPLLLAIASFTVGLAFVGSLPVAIRFALIEHVRALQE